MPPSPQGEGLAAAPQSFTQLLDKRKLVVPALNRVVGHEITHILEGTDLYDSLAMAVAAYAKTKGEYESWLQQIRELYKGKEGYTGEEGANTRFQAELNAEAKLEKELIADLVGDYLFTDKQFVEKLFNEDRGLFNWIRKQIDYIHSLCKAGSKEARQLEKAKKMFTEVVREASENGVKNPTAEGGMKYALSEYTDTQKENWKKSKKIVVYENDAQLLQFVRDSLANKDASNKMYLGVISGDLAKRIETETGLDFEGKNAVIRAKNIRKIVLHDHGNPSAEKLRGQIAVTDTDFLVIKDIFGEPDTIKLEEKGYDGKPAATFEKVIGPKKYTMFVVDSGGTLDVFVQTMYIHKNKNGSIANVANAKALTSTPKATVGTAPTNNVQHNNPSVKNTNSLSASGQVEAAGGGWDVRGQDVGLPMPEGYQEGSTVAADGPVGLPEPGFVGSYTGTTYTPEQSSLLASVSLEGIQNATDLAGKRDVSFTDIGISDQLIKQAWVDAGLAYEETNPDGDVYYVVNDAMLMDERERRQKRQKGSTSAQAAQEAGLPGLTWSRQSQQQPSRAKAGEDGVSPEAAVRAERKNLQWVLKKIF